MKKAVLFTFVILMMSYHCFAEEQTVSDSLGKWVEFTATDKSYTVMFPGQPTTTVSKKPHSITSITSYSIQEKIVFIGSYTDYDVVFEAQKELLASRDNFLKEVHAQLTTSKTIEFERGQNDWLPALVFTAEGPDSSFKSIIIVDNQRTYMFVTAGWGKIPASAEKFLDSLRLYPFKAAIDQLVFFDILDEKHHY